MSSKDDDQLEDLKTNITESNVEPTLIEKDDPLVGQKFGKYSIVARVAKGGTAVVYRALDDVLGREVAIKVLHEHLESRREVVERFKNEARVVASLRHPNVVSVYDFFSIGPRSALVVEYVPGITLSDLIKQHRRISERFVLMLATEILKGLEAAHQKGITHRDIKPANILIHPELGVKISDFGLAKLKNSDDGLTKDGIFIGTPSFSSPEQIEGKPVDHRSDIFSLGLSLYMLATGKHAFKQKGDSTTTVWFKIVRGKFQAVREIDPSISKDFERILDKALQVDPERRYASATEMLQDVRDVLKKRDLLSYESDLKKFLNAPFSSDSKQAIQKTKSKYLMISTIALLVLLVGISFYFYRQKLATSHEVVSSPTETQTPKPSKGTLPDAVQKEGIEPRDKSQLERPKETVRIAKKESKPTKKNSSSLGARTLQKGLTTSSYVEIPNSAITRLIWSSDMQKASLRFKWEKASAIFSIGETKAMLSPLISSQFSDAGFDFADWGLRKYFWAIEGQGVRELQIQTLDAYRVQMEQASKRDLIVSSEFNDVDVQINPWSQQLKLAWPTGPDAVAYRIQVAEDKNFEKIIFSGNLSFKNVVIERFWSKPTELFWKVSYLDEGRNVFLVDPVRRINLRTIGFADYFDIFQITKDPKKGSWVLQAVGPQAQKVSCRSMDDSKVSTELVRRGSYFYGSLPDSERRIYCDSFINEEHIILAVPVQN